MLAAMASAKVGDDVYGEDPTTKQLEVVMMVMMMMMMNMISMGGRPSYKTVEVAMTTKTVAKNK